MNDEIEGALVNVLDLREKRNGDLGHPTRPPSQRVRENMKEAAIRVTTGKSSTTRIRPFFLDRCGSASLLSAPSQYALPGSLPVKHTWAWHRCVLPSNSEEKVFGKSQPAPEMCHFVIIHPTMHIKFVQNIHHKNSPAIWSGSQDGKALF